MLGCTKLQGKSLGKLLLYKHNDVDDLGQTPCLHISMSVSKYVLKRLGMYRILRDEGQFSESRRRVIVSATII